MAKIAKRKVRKDAAQGDVRIDADQCEAQIGFLGLRIDQGESDLRALQSDVDRLKGRQEVWRMLQDEIRGGE